MHRIFSSVTVTQIVRTTESMIWSRSDEERIADGAELSLCCYFTDWGGRRRARSTVGQRSASSKTGKSDLSEVSHLEDTTLKIGPLRKKRQQTDSPLAGDKLLAMISYKISRNQ